MKTQILLHAVMVFYNKKGLLEYTALDHILPSSQSSERRRGGGGASQIPGVRFFHHNLVAAISNFNQKG